MLDGWTLLTVPQIPTMWQPTDENEEPIDERLPPRETRQLERRRPMCAPLMNGTMNATQIQRLNTTNEGLPPPSGPARICVLSHTFPPERAHIYGLGRWQA